MRLKRTISPFRRRRATILILTVWLIVVLSVMAYSLAYEVRLGLKSTGLNNRRLHAQALARAGLAKAVLDLKNDRLIRQAKNGLGNDTLDNIWAQTDDKTDVEMGDGGTYSVRIVDEDRKLNLNAIQGPAIPALAYLFETVGGVKAEKAQTMAEAVADFRDPDTLVSSGVGGDEAEYYTEWGLKNFGRDLAPGWTFRPKNDDLLSLDELLEIPGVTSEMLHGDGKSALLDPIERIDSEKESGALADYLTVSSGLPASAAGGMPGMPGMPGQAAATAQIGININTCSQPVIEAMINAASTGAGGGGSGLEGMAKKILDLREGHKIIKSDEGNSGITNPQQISEAGLPPDVTSKMIQMFALNVSSFSFTITSRGEYQGVHKTIQANVYVILPPPFNLDPTKSDRHRRRDQRARGILKNQPNMIIDPEIHVRRIMEL